MHDDCSSCEGPFPACSGGTMSKGTCYQEEGEWTKMRVDCGVSPPGEEGDEEELPNEDANILELTQESREGNRTVTLKVVNQTDAELTVRDNQGNVSKLEVKDAFQDEDCTDDDSTCDVTIGVDKDGKLELTVDEKKYSCETDNNCTEGTSMSGNKAGELGLSSDPDAEIDEVVIGGEGEGEGEGEGDDEDKDDEDTLQGKVKEIEVYPEVLTEDDAAAIEASKCPANGTEPFVTTGDGRCKWITQYPGRPIGSCPHTIVMRVNFASAETLEGRDLFGIANGDGTGQGRIIKGKPNLIRTPEWLLNVGQKKKCRTGAHRWVWFGSEGDYLNQIEFGSWNGKRQTMVGRYAQKHHIKKAYLRRAETVLATVFDGRKYDLYVDGEHRAGDIVVDDFNIKTNDISIGLSRMHDNPDFSGCVHEVQVHHGALSADEVKAVSYALTCQAGAYCNADSSLPMPDPVPYPAWHRSTLKAYYPQVDPSPIMGIGWLTGRLQPPKVDFDTGEPEAGTCPPAAFVDPFTSRNPGACKWTTALPAALGICPHTVFLRLDFPSKEKLMGPPKRYDQEKKKQVYPPPPPFKSQWLLNLGGKDASWTHGAFRWTWDGPQARGGRTGWEDTGEGEKCNSCTNLIKIGNWKTISDDKVSIRKLETVIAVVFDPAARFRASTSAEKYRERLYIYVDGRLSTWGPSFHSLKGGLNIKHVEAAVGMSLDGCSSDFEGCVHELRVVPWKMSEAEIRRVSVFMGAYPNQCAEDSCPEDLPFALERPTAAPTASPNESPPPRPPEPDATVDLTGEAAKDDPLVANATLANASAPVDMCKDTWVSLISTRLRSGSDYETSYMDPKELDRRAAWARMQFYSAPKLSCINCFPQYEAVGGGDNFVWPKKSNMDASLVMNNPFVNMEIKLRNAATKLPTVKGPHDHYPAWLGCQLIEDGKSYNTPCRGESMRQKIWMQAINGGGEANAGGLSLSFDIWLHRRLKSRMTTEAYCDSVGGAWEGDFAEECVVHDENDVWADPHTAQCNPPRKMCTSELNSNAIIMHITFHPGTSIMLLTEKGKPDTAVLWVSDTSMCEGNEGRCAMSKDSVMKVPNFFNEACSAIFAEGTLRFGRRERSYCRVTVSISATGALALYRGFEKFSCERPNPTGVKSFDCGDVILKGNYPNAVPLPINEALQARPNLASSSVFHVPEAWIGRRGGCDAPPLPGTCYGVDTPRRGKLAGKQVKEEVECRARAPCGAPREPGGDYRFAGHVDNFWINAFSECFCPDVFSFGKGLPAPPELEGDAQFTDEGVVFDGDGDFASMGNATKDDIEEAIAGGESGDLTVKTGLNLDNSDDGSGSNDANTNATILYVKQVDEETGTETEMELKTGAESNTTAVLRVTETNGNETKESVLTVEDAFDETCTDVDSTCEVSASVSKDGKLQIAVNDQVYECEINFYHKDERALKDILPTTNGFVKMPFEPEPDFFPRLCHQGGICTCGDGSMYWPVNFLQNTISDRTHCIAQLRPGSSFLLSVLRFVDRTSSSS